MDFFRQYILLLLIGMILISIVIIFIFFLLNKCISRRGKHKISRLEKGTGFKTDSNKYHERNPDVVNPPLPPRTQFLTAEAQSYENLAEVADYEECTADYEQSTDQQPDYVKVEEEEQNLPPPPPYDPPGPGMTAGQSYENMAEEHDYEQSTDQQPDYVQVEEEEKILHPPPPYSHPGPAGVAGQRYMTPAEEPDYEESVDQQPDYVQVEDEAETFLPHPADPSADNSSTEDYDDIGEDEGEEDYDDIG